MNDYGLGALANLAVIGLISIPLAVWKLVDIIIYLYQHLSFSWN